MQPCPVCVLRDRRAGTSSALPARHKYQVRKAQGSPLAVRVLCHSSEESAASPKAQRLSAAVFISPTSGLKRASLALPLSFPIYRFLSLAPFLYEVWSKLECVLTSGKPAGMLQKFADCSVSVAITGECAT